MELTSSVYYYADATILSKASEILGKNDDYLKYHSLAAKIKNAVNQKYLDAKKGIYAEGYQTELSVPLFWGIMPDSLKEKVAANLADSVAANNYHLDVGILGAKAVLGALSDNCQVETAYKLAAQNTFPSWGWWIVNGATTLYENWNINLTRDLSLNHIMFGEIGAWFYKTLGGIKPDEKHAGFKNIILQPNFVTDLNDFYSEHVSPYGKIISSWKRNGKEIIYNITVPANSSARINFPVTKGASVYLNKKQITNTKEYSVSSGSYTFVIK